jgi:hypothetical protein
MNCHCWKRRVFIAAAVALNTLAACSAEPEKANGPMDTQRKPRAEKNVPVIPPREGKSETILLFNGKNLDGWIGHEKHWSVQDGVIVGKSDVAVPVSTYLLTKRNFSDFRLLATVKIAKHRIHSGLAFWGRVAPEQGDPYTYAGHLLMFPNYWGLYDLFGRGDVKSFPRKIARKVGHQRDWNEIEILCQGNRIREVVNGVLVADWRDPEPDRIKEGPIGLQLHDEEPQEVHFKNLMLTTFPEDKLLTVKESKPTKK